MKKSCSAVCFQFGSHVFAFTELRSEGPELPGRGKAERKEERGDDGGSERGRK